MVGVRKITRVIIGIVALLFLVVLIGPFLIPIPPAGGQAAARELADPDSQFIEINDIELHYKRFGSGQPAMILLHGFGASLFSWREVTQPLSEWGVVIAYDRPAFGLTERPMPGEWEGESPYSAKAQVELLVGLMDALRIPEAILIGNSAGGTVATLTALTHPERVQALVLVDPAIYVNGGGERWMRFLYNTPQMQRLGPYLARSIVTRGDELIRLAWHDPSKITPDVLEGYRKPLQLPNWDKALWELTIASEPLDLAERLAQIQAPVLVVTGDDDRLVPPEDSIRLAMELPNAELVVFQACGHVPQEECPQAFLEAVVGFVQRFR